MRLIRDMDRMVVEGVSARASYRCRMVFVVVVVVEWKGEGSCDKNMKIKIIENC